MTLELIVGLIAIVLSLASMVISLVCIYRLNKIDSEINYHLHSKHKLMNCAAVKTWKAKSKQKSKGGEVGE